MSFFKNLLANWLGGNYRSGHHGNQYGSYDKHGRVNPFNPPPAAPFNPANQATITCPKCRTINSADAKFCAQCGTALSPGLCSACNQPLALGDKFCGKCGKAV